MEYYDQIKKSIELDDFKKLMEFNTDESQQMLLLLSCKMNRCDIIHYFLKESPNVFLNIADIDIIVVNNYLQESFYCNYKYPDFYYHYLYKICLLSALQENNLDILKLFYTHKKKNTIYYLRLLEHQIFNNLSYKIVKWYYENINKPSILTISRIKDKHPYKKTKWLHEKFNILFGYVHIKHLDEQTVKYYYSVMKKKYSVSVYIKNNNFINELINHKNISLELILDMYKSLKPINNFLKCIIRRSIEENNTKLLSRFYNDCQKYFIKNIQNIPSSKSLLCKKATKDFLKKYLDLSDVNIFCIEDIDKIGKRLNIYIRTLIKYSYYDVLITFNDKSIIKNLFKNLSIIKNLNLIEKIFNYYKDKNLPQKLEDCGIFSVWKRIKNKKYINFYLKYIIDNNLINQINFGNIELMTLFINPDIINLVKKHLLKHIEANIGQPITARYYNCYKINGYMLWLFKYFGKRIIHYFSNYIERYNQIEFLYYLHDTGKLSQYNINLEYFYYDISPLSSSYWTYNIFADSVIRGKIYTYSYDIKKNHIINFEIIDAIKNPSCKNIYEHLSIHSVFDEKFKKELNIIRNHIKYKPNSLAANWLVGKENKIEEIFNQKAEDYVYY